MDVTLYVVVMATAVLVSLVVLSIICLRCRNKGPLVSIRQAHSSEESSEFRIIHPSQPIFCRSIHPPTNLPSLYSTSTDTGIHQNRRTSSPTDTGSGYVNDESDVEDSGYIIVLPQTETPSTNHSPASTPSSDLLHDYENVPEKKEDREYLNVDTLNPHNVSDSDDDDDDDDEGNYVNVQDGTLTG